jgi:hypothetical protein
MHASTLLNSTERPALPDYLTSSELQIKLRVNRITLWNLRNRGLIPYIKLGGRVLFDPASVAKALEKLTVSGNS